MRRSLLLAALAALAAATPAAAADIAGLDCPHATMSPAERDGVAEAAAAMPEASDRRLEPLREAAQACARRLRWSPAATSNAVAYHAAIGAAAVVRRRLVAAGVDIVPLENAILGDRVLRDALGPNRDNQAAMSGFLTRHGAVIQSILEGRSGDLQEAVGNFVGFLIGAHAMRVGFIAN